MTIEESEVAQEISFSQELARKATHMGALVIPGGYYVLKLSRIEVLAIMVPIAVLMVLIDISRLREWAFWRKVARPIISPIIRKHEMDGDFTGATYILITACLTIGLFDKPIAIAALAFIIVGDSFAAIIGRRWGKHRIGRKSIEGSLGCLLGTLIVAALTPGLPFSVAAFGAVVATVTEFRSLKIDDNVSVPLVSGLAMMLLGKVI
jgi:dolichol kinase